jgi:hypothetical protein
MALRKSLKLICPAACAFCLAVGYALAGKWVALVLVGLVWIAWLFSDNWPPTLLLAASVALAAGGVWAGASPFLMIGAATLALVSWDVMNWEAFLTGELTGEVEARLERTHFAVLGLTVGPSLLLVLVGRLIQVPIPFGVLVFLVLLTFFGVDRLWHLVKK